MEFRVRNLNQLTVTSPRVIDVHRFSSIHSVDDVDGGGDHVVSRDLASFTAGGLLDSRYAYSVAYIVRDRQQVSTTRRKMAMTDTAEQNKALVLKAFETLFNRRDYAAALRFWSPDYIQHSAHIEPGRDGLFDLVKNAPADMHYENALIIADGDYVMAHGRLSNTGLADSWIAVDIVRLQDGVFAEHWDVLQFEATAEESKSGLPMFGDTFPTRA
jgi:predicted SnoaL-like aldol condensation-catalyzing enzyme